MTRSFQAVYEKGVLRPVEPVPLKEHQQVTVSVSDQEEGDWLDAAFLRYLETQADDSVTLDLHRKKAIDRVVSADKDLLGVAAVEGLVVFDPENP